MNSQNSPHPPVTEGNFFAPIIVYPSTLAILPVLGNETALLFMG
jgi:hypothetical protein